MHAVPTREGGSWLKLAGSHVLEGGPGPENVASVFDLLCSTITYLLYKFTLSDQTQVTLQLTVRLSDFGGWGEGSGAIFVFTRPKTRCGRLCVPVAHFLVPCTGTSYSSMQFGRTSNWAASSVGEILRPGSLKACKKECSHTGRYLWDFAAFVCLWFRIWTQALAAFRHIP